LFITGTVDVFFSGGKKVQTVKCSYLVIKICGVVKFCTHVFRDNLITVTYLIALLRVKGN